MVSCVLCTVKLDYFNFQLGHDIPDRHGGENTIDNLLPICQSCNSSMGTERISVLLYQNELNNHILLSLSSNKKSKSMAKAQTKIPAFYRNLIYQQKKMIGGMIACEFCRTLLTPGSYILTLFEGDLICSNNLVPSCRTCKNGKIVEQKESVSKPTDRCLRSKNTKKNFETSGVCPWCYIGFGSNLQTNIKCSTLQKAQKAQKAPQTPQAPKPDEKDESEDETLTDDDEEGFICPWCQKEFVSDNNLQKHLRNKICRKETSRKETSRKETGKKSIKYMCRYCQKKFSVKEAYDNHLLYSNISGCSNK
jgi:hypothetical protein